MSQLNGESFNIEENNIEKLVQLFPEVQTDGKIDFDKLKQILGDYVDDSEERYRFVWNGKGEALRLSQTPSMGTLRPAKEEGESKNWDETENLYIEGDNLEVLKLLQKSYFNKVKMIYIDPPYNTGGDFVYKDNFKDNIQNYKKITGQVDSEGNATTTNREYSGRYHTDWLNMMYPRLKLARNLLTDDGAIFISIDEHEVHNLKKICDEIFGDENYITELIWEKKKKPSFLNTNLGTKIEYVLVYGKDRIKVGALSVDTTEEGKKYPLNNAGNSIGNLVFPPNSVRFTNINNQTIPPQDMSKGNIKTELMNELIIENNYNVNEFTLKGEWRYSQEKLNEIINEKEEIVISNIPFRPNHVKQGGEIKKMHNLLTISTYNVGTNEDATAEQEKLLGKNYFDYTKPTGLINFLVRSLTYNEPNSIILDFFSGSGTTAQAVIEQNSKDNGNRKFIMVQLPEPIEKELEAFKDGYENIAEIGKERIRRAGEKVKTELKEKYEAASEEERKELKHPDELDIGFKVFKLDSSNIKEWNPGKYENVQQAIEDALTPYVPGRTEEDVVYEMMLKMGLDLTYPVEEIDVNGKTIYSIGYGFLMICLADNIEIAVAEKMIEIKDENNQQEFRAIFRDEGFKSDTDKTNVKETLRSAGLAEESFITL